MWLFRFTWLFKSSLVLAEMRSRLFRISVRLFQMCWRLVKIISGFSKLNIVHLTIMFSLWPWNKFYNIFKALPDLFQTIPELIELDWDRVRLFWTLLDLTETFMTLPDLFKALVWDSRTFPNFFKTLQDMFPRLSLKFFLIRSRLLQTLVRLCETWHSRLRNFPSFQRSSRF